MARSSPAMTTEKKATGGGTDAVMTWADAMRLDDRTPRAAVEKRDVESSGESLMVTELASSLRSLDRLHDALLGQGRARACRGSVKGGGRQGECGRSHHVRAADARALRSGTPASASMPQRRAFRRT